MPKVVPLIAYQLADQLLCLEMGVLTSEVDQARVLRLAGVTDLPRWTRDPRDRSWTVVFPRSPGEGLLDCVGSGRTRPAAWLAALRTLLWLVSKEWGEKQAG
jgi:hypothetical protein